MQQKVLLKEHTLGHAGDNIREFAYSIEVKRVLVIQL